MTDLVEFLRVRLRDDEQVARFVEDGPGEVPRRGLDPMRISIEGEVRFAHLTVDPARVLREVEAKRRIIELHPHAHWPVKVGPPHLYCETCDVEDGMIGGDGCYRSTLRLLALPFADHPDYREEWKP